MAEVKSSSTPIIGFPRIVLAEALESALPLEHTQVSVQITGPVASVVVTQRFRNPLEAALEGAPAAPAELDYLFPLPGGAAITGFELQIGQRQVKGSLQELEAAREAYDEASGQGKHAGLFEQRRPNLFAVRLANVQPGETIHTRVQFQQQLKFEDASYEFVYPMGLTPKYDSPQHPQEGQGVHAPIAKPGERIGPVEINLAVDAGMPVEQPVSPSHALEVVRLDERRFQVRLGGDQPDENIPDHDFVLRYALAGNQVQAAAWASKQDGGAFFLATLVPPALENDSQPMPREFIFVLDRSGSMSGEPILQARNALRACLRTLNPEDTFRVLLFDNELEWFQPEALAVTQEHVDRADAYLENVKGRGGTEIVRALDAVLTTPVDEGRMRFVVFLTDGAVSAETRLLENLRGRIGAARLFTFGVGPSVNRALLSRMAELGRGRSSFLQLNEDIEGAIIRFQDSVSFPALTDITLAWENGKAWDVYPARLPDLYYGQPLEIRGRMQAEGGQPVKLTARGKRWQGNGGARNGGARIGGAETVTLELNLAQPAGQDLAVERLWAQARVEDLLDQMELEPQRMEKIRAEIIGLALEYNLATVYTAFVAVDTVSAVAGGKPRIIHVAQPLPEGLQRGPFLPRTRSMGMLNVGAMIPSPAAMPGMARNIVSRGQAFMAKLTGEDRGLSERGSSGELARGQAVPDQAAAPGGLDREAVLRRLARTQKVDGSWNEDIEWTAAAVLAFLRAGHTTRVGSYRQALRRAVRYLVEHASPVPEGKRPAGFLIAAVLTELAAATGEADDQKAAHAIRLALPAPVNDLETAALGQPVQVPGAVASLDDLRIAALLRAPLAVPRELLAGEQGELAQIWGAAL